MEKLQPEDLVECVPIKLSGRYLNINEAMDSQKVLHNGA